MAAGNDTLTVQIVPPVIDAAPQQKESDPVKIPRPPNAWILFRADIFRSMSEDGSKENMSQSTVSKVISKMWNSLDGPTKQYYERLAEVKKMEHALKYPNYRYTPKSKEQKEREKMQKRLNKAAAASSRTSRRARATEAPGSSPVDPVQYSVIASTPSTSSNSTGGPTPPLSVNNSPSPTSTDEITLAYPFPQNPQPSAEDRRIVSRRNRQTAPYTRPAVSRSRQGEQDTTLDAPKFSTAQVINGTGTVGIYSQDSYDYVIGHDATNWVSEQPQQPTAFPAPLVDFYQPQVTQNITQVPATEPTSLQVEMGPTKTYTSWIADAQVPATEHTSFEVEMSPTNLYASWNADLGHQAQFDNAAVTNPNTVGYGATSALEVTYDTSGFYAQPAYGIPTALALQPADDELQTWFDFNGFGDQTTADDTKNVEVAQFNETSWNAYAYLPH